MLETQDLRDFSITAWYNTFEDITIKTIILELPEEVVEKIISTETDDRQIEEVCSDQFKSDLRNALNTLKNDAFIKNNWHAPMDAKMFSFGNTLQVTTVSDIFLYFTVSTTIQEDFSNIKCVAPCLAIKKWINIHPASEFRCIVINNVLRGITSRDWPTFYAHFKEDGPQIIERLSNFYAENIKLRFPRKNYTFDIALSYPDDPFIVDFGPLNSKTNLYAFSWTEIAPLLQKEAIEEVAPVFRYLESDLGIMTRTDALYRVAKNQA